MCNSGASDRAFIHTAHHHVHAKCSCFIDHALSRGNAAAFCKFNIDTMKVLMAFFNILFEHKLSSANKGKGDFSYRIFMPPQSSFASGCSIISTPSSFSSGIFRIAVSADQPAFASTRKMVLYVFAVLLLFQCRYLYPLLFYRSAMVWPSFCDHVFD